jgi:DNA-binding HxlR family transcriptional regulator
MYLRVVYLSQVTDDAKLKVFRTANVIGQGYDIIEILRQHPDGISFSQILKQTAMNPNTLTRKLWALMEEGIIERTLMRPDEKRRYSFYKITPQGSLFIDKLEEMNYFV